MISVEPMEYTAENISRIKNYVLANIDRYDDYVRVDVDKWLVDTINNKDVLFLQVYDVYRDPDKRDPIATGFVTRNFVLLVHLCTYKPKAFVKHFPVILQQLRVRMEEKYGPEPYFFPVMLYNRSAEPLIRSMCPYFITHEAATLYHGKAAVMRLYVGRIDVPEQEG